MSLLVLVGYLVAVGWLALRPISVPWVAPANVELFATIEPELQHGMEHAVRSLGGDLALLAPLGVLLPLSAGLRNSRTGSFFRTVTGTGMLACLLEVLRSSVPGHMANVDSALLHTTGAALAHLALYPVVRALVRRAAGGASVGAADGGDVKTKVAAVPIRQPSQGPPPKSTRVRLAPRADVSRGSAPYV